jgi:hypothetical protein
VGITFRLENYQTRRAIQCTQAPPGEHRRSRQLRQLPTATHLSGRSPPPHAGVYVIMCSQAPIEQRRKHKKKKKGKKMAKDGRGKTRCPRGHGADDREVQLCVKKGQGEAVFVLIFHLSLHLPLSHTHTHTHMHGQERSPSSDTEVPMRFPAHD